MSDPSIAIVGAGPSGLVLARVLRLHGIASTVDERGRRSRRPRPGRRPRHETAMFPRGATAAEQSAQGLAMCFAADSPRGIVDFFAGLGRGQDETAATGGPKHQEEIR